MNCPNCGKEARGSFCTGCGTRLDASAAGQAAPAFAPRPTLDPDATSVINHQELRAFLAQAAQMQQQPEQPGPAAKTAPITPNWDVGAPAAPPSSTPAAPPPAGSSPFGAAPSGPAPTGAAPFAFDPVGVGAPSDSGPGYASTQAFTAPSFAAPAVAPISPMAPPVATTYAPPSSHPVNLFIDKPPQHSRFFAIPILGILARYIMLIPHLLVLELTLIGVMACQLVLWAFVLFGGRYPDWGYNFVGGWLRWQVRVQAYFLGLTDAYPYFGFADQGAAYPVHATIDIPPTNKRLYAIPALGLLIREVMLIPHIIVLYLLGLATGVLFYVMWIPVLFTGRYPDGPYSFMTGTLRWSMRVYAFLLGLTDKYPPFQLGS